MNTAVCAQGVVFRYAGEPVIGPISFRIEAGSRVGLVGPSGCGKSTLLKLIAGLYAANSGMLTVMGESRPEHFREHIAMVMQNAPLFPASIRDNITCGHPMAEERIRTACEAAQLTDWIATLPEGLDTFAGERGNRLSGGQAQRVAIARAIARDAAIVLLDEATSALDGETEQAVLVALQHLMAGRTVISATHRLDTLEGFDCVYRFERGGLV